jgi:hypothetical protein
MVALFALRLAAGMMAALLVLTPSQVNPRFYRVQYLTSLGLAALAAFFVRDLLFQGPAGIVAGALLVACLLAAFTGSVIWSLRDAPGGRALGVVSFLVFGAALCAAEWAARRESPLMFMLLVDGASAAVLGAAITAMLMGHSYLIAPSMSIVPLMRLLGALFSALLLRMALAALGLWCDGSSDSPAHWCSVGWLGRPPKLARRSRRRAFSTSWSSSVFWVNSRDSFCWPRPATFFNSYGPFHDRAIYLPCL